MATNTAGDQGQEYHTNQVHYLEKKITYLDNGQTVTVGQVPPYAAIIRAGVVVTTAFNGNSSNVLDIGTTADPDGFATDIALGTIGVIVADEMATTDDSYSASARTIVAPVVATASATAGEGIVWVEYIVRRGV
jgi:hypothetical protein